MKKNKNIHKNTLNQSYNSQNQSILNIHHKNDKKSKQSNNTIMNMSIKNK